MKLSDLWRISRTVYKEVSFQSIFSLRSGGLLAQKADTDVKKLVRNAEFNTWISKILMSVFITVFALMVFVPLDTGTSGRRISPELTVVGTVSSFLTVLLFLIVVMGLQVSTSFFSSKVIDILSPLPLTKTDMSTVSFLCFVRIFDVPLVIAAIGFPTAFYYFVGVAAGALSAFLGILVTEMFALALTTGLAKFFYAKIAGANGRSLWKTLLRGVLMLVWILPSFGAYVVINFWAEIIQFFASLTRTVVALPYVVVLLYPFSYGFLVSYATFTQGLDYVSLALAVAACLGYAALAGWSVKWVAQTIRSMNAGGIVASAREIVKDTFIKPQTALLGIIRKDLRIASRMPSYASMLLLPAIQTVILVFTFLRFEALGASEMLGILTGMSFLTVLIPPTLFSIEGLASAYTKSLPLTKRTVIFSKTALATLTYAISLIVVLVVTFFMQRSPQLVLAYGSVHMLAVAAANMLEILILTEKFWKGGFALGNIYAKLSTYILVLIPGATIIFMPVLVAILSFAFAPKLVLFMFFVVAFVEFTSVTALTFLMSSRKRTTPKF